MLMFFLRINEYILEFNIINIKFWLILIHLKKKKSITSANSGYDAYIVVHPFEQYIK